MISFVRKTLIIVLFCLCVSCPAWAVACFSSDEAQAEAALHYHTELRITGLSCKSADGVSLYPAYQKFTANNQGLLQSYQDRLLAYYKANGKGDAAARLHAHETEIENDLALTAAHQGLDAFCQARSLALQGVVLDSGPEVERKISAYQAQHPLSTKICKDPPSR